ncbi:MAG: class I SAM-dependent methyltransferase [Candidatus Sedimenticola sp. 6PFRAG7]
MDTSIYKEMKEIEKHHWWFTARREIVEETISKLDIEPDARILDVGCGTGGNLEMLNRVGVVTGIEMNSLAADLATKSSNATIKIGSLPNNLPLDNDETFDLIVALDVIEHIEQDLESLVAVSRHMGESGKIVITVPAFQFLWGHHDEIHHHKRRYRKSDLEKLASEAGLKIRKLSYYNFFLFPLAAALRLYEKLVPPSPDKSTIAPPSSWLNKIFHSVFASERHLLNAMNFPFGVSLLMVLEKN